MTDSTAKRPALTLAVVLSSLLVVFPMLVGRVVEAILDTTNPAGVDVTQPLAYLREILVWGFGSLGVLLVVIVVVLVVSYRRGRSIALPLIVLAVQVAVGLVMLALGALINNGG